MLATCVYIEQHPRRNNTGGPGIAKGLEKKGNVNLLLCYHYITYLLDFCVVEKRANRPGPSDLNICISCR